MTANSSFPLKDQREKQKFLIEVANTENQLWSLIHSKGLLHSEVKDLYRKVRSTYENLILSDRDQLELQDIEYSLWKLHYKRIDEFRKRIKGSFVNAESKKLAVPQNDNHVEGFKLFLSEAIEFYQNLIVKIRKRNRLPEESVFLTFAEQKKMQKCQFLCHRFLVCVGDLARYKEQYEKPDAQNRNWSVAATNYLEATVIWPDSGNPHNQLAVLAIYIGDEFLALYHCIRSLAVKEPFPDAQGNLILLFERSRSSHLYSLSSESHFDFLNPSERSILQTISKSSNHNMLKAEHNCYTDTKLWSLIIGTLSFFHIKSSEDEFPCAFASTMGELEALMALDDTKLKVTLESYQHMDSVRKGPFRALQVVSVLIFTIQNLIKTAEIKESRDKNDVQQKELTQWALTATFIFMGRFVERSLKDGATETCPLLPAVLVFVEWLVIMLDGAEMHGVDEKSRSAMSYFFGAFVDLLKRFNVNEDEAKYAEVTPLWEDYELRGFAPVACAHASLDFSSHWVYIDKFDTAIDCRAQRIINAAIKIADKSIGSQKWIVYDKSGREFSKVYRAESKEYPELERLESNNSDVNQKVPSQPIHEAPEESEKQMIAGDNSSSNGKSVTIEDEEVILFRPLTRHNSAPLKISSALNDPTPTKGMGDHSVPSDECLRRATSLLIAQNQAQIDPLSFHADITNFTRSQQEPRVQDRVAQPFLETPIAAGPPSLSAWVLDGGNMSNNREKSTSGSGKHGSRLSPIEEIASESLDGLSISENGFASIHLSYVIKFVAACRKPPVYCVVTEYLSEGSLRAYLHKLEDKSLPLEKLIAIALDIARGMEYIHSQGVIHRDLKPENVLIDQEFHLKIADFGIACEEAYCDSLADDPGTYRWMAPEMIKRKSYGRKVDVYSFGLVFWEMVAGAIPYEDMNPIQAAFAVVNKNLRPVIPKDCPSAMRLLIEQCWSLQPDKRPEFCQVVKVLEQFESSLARDGTLTHVQNLICQDHKKGLLHRIHKLGPVHPHSTPVPKPKFS